MVALCKAPTKSAGIGLPITAVCKNAGKKTLGQDDFFVVIVLILISFQLNHCTIKIFSHKMIKRNKLSKGIVSFLSHGCEIIEALWYSSGNVI